MISLVDSKRSMSVNIVVKLFRLPIEEIISAIETLNSTVLTEERLQALQKLFPIESEEINVLTSFDGEFSMLAEAEKFIYKLIKVSFIKINLLHKYIVKFFYTKIVAPFYISTIKLLLFNKY